MTSLKTCIHYPSKPKVILTTWHSKFIEAMQKELSKSNKLGTKGKVLILVPKEESFDFWMYHMLWNGIITQQCITKIQQDQDGIYYLLCRMSYPLGLK